MKLTKENYELIMFDLMEGNLPEDVTKKLYKQIESDPFFMAEWALLKHTVLTPETVVYPKKDKLIKPTGRVILMPAWARYVSYAAILILGVFGLVQYANWDRTPAPDMSGSVVESLESVPAQSVPETGDEITGVVVDQTQVPDIQSKAAMAKNQSEIQPMHVQAQSSAEPETAHNISSEELGLIRPEYAFVSASAREVATLATLQSNSEEYQPEGSDVTYSVNTRIEDMNSRLTFNDAYAFLRSATQFSLQAFRNPTIRVKRGERNQNEGIDILFSTDKYYASAFVELKK